MAIKRKPVEEEELEEIEPAMDKVIAWRVHCFEGMGFEGTLALRLASDRSVDLRKMERALATGLPHALAADLLGPLNDL